MSKPATQRADPLIPLPALLAELGIDPASFLNGFGLSSNDLSPGRLLPFETVLRILQGAADQTSREDLGLLLGSRHSLDVLGPIAPVMRSATTLGEALIDLTILQVRNTSGASTYLHRQKDQFFLGYGIFAPELPVTPILHDFVLAVGCRMISELTCGAVCPREYLSMRRMPDSPGIWEMLGATIRFEEVETGFYLSPADFAFRLTTANETIHDQAFYSLHSEPSIVPDEWTHRARKVLRGLLMEGQSSMADVARALGVGDRTLRRSLAREGATFEHLRDDVRLAIAHDLLSMSSLAIGDLAVTLDFSTPSTFIRAFRRWTGKTPAAWRQAHGMIGHRTRQKTHPQRDG